MDYDDIITRVYSYIRNNYPDKPYLLLGFNSWQAIGNRISTAKKPKVKPLIQILIEWAINEKIDLNWLITGKEKPKTEPDNVAYIDSATRILDEVIAETGAENIITEKFKKEIIQLLREELAENEKRTKEKFLRIVAAVGG